MTDEAAVRREMLDVLDRCVNGAAPIFSYIEFELAYAFDDALSDAFRDQLGGLALLAEEYDRNLRGPEDFLDQARQILAQARSSATAAGS